MQMAKILFLILACLAFFPACQSSDSTCNQQPTDGDTDCPTCSTCADADKTSCPSNGDPDCQTCEVCPSCGDPDCPSCPACDGDVETDAESDGDLEPEQPRQRIGNDCRNNHCFPVAPTGQKTCYDNVGEIPCPGEAGSVSCAETPFCGQDAQYAPQMETSERFVISSLNEKEVVTDRQTGLVWERESFNQRWATASGHCFSLAQDDSLDWRLPSLLELRSIVNHDYYDPVIDDQLFEGVDICGWTSSLAFWGYPITLTMWNGLSTIECGGTGGPDTYAEIRCVHGGPEIKIGERFETLQHGVEQSIIWDRTTLLQWQSNIQENKTWQEALSYCEALDYSGYSDWRLPNINEAVSLTDMAFYPQNDILATQFPAMPKLRFHTSTTYAGDHTINWIVDYFERLYQAGHWDHTDKTTPLAVRCVRGRSYVEE